MAVAGSENQGSIPDRQPEILSEKADSVIFFTIISIIFLGIS
jgi:hypothetical protein